MIKIFSVSFALWTRYASTRSFNWNAKLKAWLLQREQFALVQKQSDRTERIQDRAEHIQATSAQLVAGARKALAIILPIVIVLIIYLPWLIFR